MVDRPVRAAWTLKLRRLPAGGAMTIAAGEAHRVKPPGDEMLTDAQRGRIEERLVEERGRAIEALDDFDETYRYSLLERTGETSVYRFHLADIGSESMEEEQQFAMASSQGDRLYRIDAALRRLYDTPESFGLCANCGRDIGFERLEIVPEGSLCVECQRAAEG